MNTFEKCQQVRRLIMNRAAEVMAYQSWDNDFAAKQIKEIPSRLSENERAEDFFGINPSDMTGQEMADLGFGLWSEDNPMRLIPLWLFPFLADEFESECIDGEKQVMRKADMDNDNRFGCLAYGVIPAKASQPPTIEVAK
jgi:hypothetical protein